MTFKQFSECWDFDPYISCCRWNNLVYVRTLKNASEFFYRNLTQTAGWQPIDYKEINWEQDHAFSYLREPVERRLKGIAEYLVTHDGHTIIDSPVAGKILGMIPFIDEHASSLSLLYGNKLRMIDWIPLSDNHADAPTWTDCLLDHYSHPRINWNREFEHTGDYNSYKKIFNKVKDYWEQGKDVRPAVLKLYLKLDLDFYQEVIGKFQPNATDWPTMSWMPKKVLKRLSKKALIS